MIDKLDCVAPSNSPWSANLRKMVDISEQPQWRGKVWRRGGAAYERRGDLRPLGMPVIIHQGPRFKAIKGDKVELIDVGDMTRGEMDHWLTECYDVPASIFDVVRLDACADLQNVPVSFFRDRVRTARKQLHDEYLSESRQVSMRGAETVYYGRKPGQTRVYDKTAERRLQLQRERRQMSKESLRNLGPDEQARIPLDEHFFAKYGYPMFQQVTRVERQMGAREPAKRYGIEKIGNLGKLFAIDPFEQMIFPEQTGTVFLNMYVAKLKRFDQKIAAKHLVEMLERDGLENTRNYMRRTAGGWKHFGRHWNTYGPLLTTLHHGKTQTVTRKDVTAAFTSSLWKQFAA